MALRNRKRARCGLCRAFMQGYEKIKDNVICDDCREKGSNGPVRNSAGLDLDSPHGEHILRGSGLGVS